MDEVAQHRLGDFEVGDDTVFERADGDDAPRRAAEHPFGFSANGKHFLAAAPVTLLHRDYGGFVANDPLVFYVDQSVGCPEINGQVVGENAEKGIEHQKTPCFMRSTANSIT